VEQVQRRLGGIGGGLIECSGQSVDGSRIAAFVPGFEKPGGRSAEPAERHAEAGLGDREAYATPCVVAHASRS
jgi:hypothetical protein